MVKLFLQNRKIFITLCFASVFPLCFTEAAKGDEMIRRDLTKLEEQLLGHENYKRHPYPCSAGKLTVGIGRNLEDKGLSFDEALYLLRNDIEECEMDLHKIFAGFDIFSDDRQYALIDLRLNLGPTGFRKFEKMIDAIKRGDFFDAATELMMSDWYDQVSIERGCLIVEMLLGDAEDDDLPEESENSSAEYGVGMGGIYFDDLIDLDGFVRSVSSLIPWEDLLNEKSYGEERSVPITEE